MKRYLVFKSDHYYPAGGWDDFKNAFDDLEEARVSAICNNFQWSHIVDTQTMEIIDET